MGINVSLISFVPATLIRSKDVNANFAALNAATGFTGGVPTINMDAGKITSDGNGNIKMLGRLGKTVSADIIDWSNSATDTYIKAGTGGSIQFVVGAATSANAGAVAKLVASVDTTGLHILSGGFSFVTGSLSRSSFFTGNAPGSYNHGNNGVPSMLCPMQNNLGTGGPPTDCQAIGFDSPSATSAHITNEFPGNPFKCWVIAF